MTPSLVSSPPGCFLHLVLVQHPRLECICRVGNNGCPLPSSWRHRKRNPEGPERNYETSMLELFMSKRQV